MISFEYSYLLSYSSPLEAFKKGIKRDSRAFSPLKDMKQWDKYKRFTMAQACAQDVADVLDPTYVPLTQEAKDLFAAKQQFMYAKEQRANAWIVFCE